MICVRSRVVGWSRSRLTFGTLGDTSSEEEDKGGANACHEALYMCQGGQTRVVNVYVTDPRGRGVSFLGEGARPRQFQTLSSKNLKRPHSCC